MTSPLKVNRLPTYPRPVAVRCRLKRTPAFTRSFTPLVTLDTSAISVNSEMRSREGMLLQPCQSNAKATR